MKGGEICISLDENDGYLGECKDEMTAANAAEHDFLCLVFRGTQILSVRSNFGGSDKKNVIEFSRDTLHISFCGMVDVLLISRESCTSSLFR